MKPYDPNTFAHTLPPVHRQWLQSVQQVLTGNVDMGTPTGNAPSTAGVNAGVYTQFEQGNSSGILVRIAATGVSGTGAPYNWNGAGASITINHGLNRQPIGFHVVDMDKAVQVYRTEPPTTENIILAPSDDTASVTVYIF